ncbi:META domain-containing protein [bacterium]|nr:MAG: META domain-containing protein [bacterium]
MTSFLNLITCIIFFVSCSGMPPKELSIEAGKWELTEFMGNSFEIKDKKITIEFSVTENSVFGFSGCNTFRGSYKTGEGNRIELSQLASTKRACLDMEMESRFLEMLQKVDNYSIKDSVLSLNKARMTPFARFQLVKN